MIRKHQVDMKPRQWHPKNMTIYPATSKRRNIEDSHSFGEGPSMGFHRKEPGGASRPVPYIPADIRRKFERWERAKLKAVACRAARETERRERQQARENDRQAWTAQRALHHPRTPVDKAMLRTLYDENTGIPQLAAFFNVSETTVKRYLKERA